QDRMVERHDLHSQLARAVAGTELTLRYQPVVVIAAGEVVGFEPLVRWLHGSRAPIPPELFICLAEETGHIGPLCSWMLENAVIAIACLERANGGDRQPYVSVNVSAGQLRDVGFVEQVGEALRTPGLVPG